MDQVVSKILQSNVCSCSNRVKCTSCSC